MKKAELLDDSEFIAALNKGDAAAFNDLFGRYGKRLYFFAYGYLKSKEGAEDVVQEVFFKLWKFRQQINKELSFKSYLFKIAYNHIQELFLKINREQAYKHEIINISVDFTSEMEEKLDYQSLLELTDHLINQLPPRQKEILILKRKDGLTVKEITEMLNISPKTVENHLTEALKSLKKGLIGAETAGLVFFFLFVHTEI